MTKTDVISGRYHCATTALPLVSCEMTSFLEETSGGVQKYRLFSGRYLNARPRQLYAGVADIVLLLPS